MSDFQKASLTAYGASRILGANVGEIMTFTSIGLGSGFLNLENLYNVTTLAEERQRFPISERTIDGDMFSASCHVTSVEPPAGIYLREMGLYIADKDYPNDPTKDHLFAVTCVDDSDPGANYVVFLPKSSTTTLIDYTFTIHAIVSPSSEIVVKGIDPGTNDFRLRPASLTVLGGIISSPSLGKISVNPDTGEAEANGLMVALNWMSEFTSEYAPYSLPVAAPNALGGLKSSSGEGHVSIDPETQEGVVNGYAGLRDTVAGLAGVGFMSEIEALRSKISSGEGLPTSSINSPGIVQLSNGLCQDETKAPTLKAIDDLQLYFDNSLVSIHNDMLHQSELISVISSGATLPQASLDNPGIVQLSNDISQDETIAPTLKAVDDLRQSLEGQIAELTARLELLESGSS